MPRAIVEDNCRLALRISAADKMTLTRAVELASTDMTDFILSHALKAARRVIARTERLALSERDSLRALAALENPPPPNQKLRTAAARLARRSQPE